MDNQELTLLSAEQINDKENQLEVIKKYGAQSAATDLCILTGCYLQDDIGYNIPEDRSLKGRTSWYWTKTDDNDNDVLAVSGEGTLNQVHRYGRNMAIRPVIHSPEIFDVLFPTSKQGYNKTEEVEFGEYPQYAADKQTQKELENKYQKETLKTTGRSYTFDSARTCEQQKGFIPVTYNEYEHKGAKYIRVLANGTSDYKLIEGELSNGVTFKNGQYIWLKVSPVVWLADDITKTLVSKRGLVAGIRFLDSSIEYKGNFEETELKEYLDKYMSKDMFQGLSKKSINDMTSEEKELLDKKINKMKKRRNPYNFRFKEVSEEEIIRGAIESNIAVFLHGPSSEGKSARVKQIDSDCEIIYLRNASPESLNGKSVYNAETGEMIDIKPSWLKKLEAKCEKEPDKLHILFFDEITNAMPSIQGIAFNIVLDKEVNGIWKLPSNARIVAAGNDMQDSLAANQIAEPLFNRFAHVYIKTTTENWLKWASEHNIHPAIYAYIAFKNGETLRSKYDGEKPNADPRKWEMASKMLYATGNPEMIRALVGEDITKEFVQFCNQQVIILEDVITGNYSENEVKSLNIAEKYATTMGLSNVDEDHLETVRNFVKDLGAEFTAIFDAMWTHGDEKRLERLAEAKLAEASKGGMKIWPKTEKKYYFPILEQM